MVAPESHIAAGRLQLRVDITPQEADNPGAHPLSGCPREAAHLLAMWEHPRLTREVVEGQLYKLVGALANDREDYKPPISPENFQKIKGLGWANRNTSPA